MLDIPDYRPEMSEQRAQEIVNFIQGTDEEVKFGNIQSAQFLGQLAQTAYNTLGLTVPGNLGKLVKGGVERIGKQHPRLGLSIGPERARHLVDHLTGKKENANFRKEDDIHTQRLLCRKAIAQVSFTEEKRTGQSQDYFVTGVNQLIEEKYPLIEDELGN